MTQPRKIRLLTEYEGLLYRSCKLIFTAGDVSLYLVPYAAGRCFFVGGSGFAEQEATVQVDTTQGAAADTEPKLSIHESGQVHIQIPGRRIGSEQTLPLSEFRGEHVATVTVDRFPGLQRHEGEVRTTGEQRDFILQSPVESGRLALYANALEPMFAAEAPCPIVVSLTRRTLKMPLHIGILAVGQELLRPVGTGVTVLAGWNPRLREGAPQRFLYVRGQ